MIGGDNQNGFIYFFIVSSQLDRKMEEAPMEDLKKGSGYT